MLTGYSTNLVKGGSHVETEEQCSMGGMGRMGVERWQVVKAEY